MCKEINYQEVLSRADPDESYSPEDLWNNEKLARQNQDAELKERMRQLDLRV